MVETQSGQFLGHVSGFELETDTGVIEKYYVRSKMAILSLWEKNLIINKSQIINFDQDKMVVDDVVVKIMNSKIRKLTQVGKLEKAEPAVTSEIDNL